MNSAYFTPPHRIPAGNYFEMAVKLSQLTWGHNTQSSIPFTPEPGDRFQVTLLQHGGKGYRCSNVSINGTTLTFSINGDIAIGLYSLEIIVTRADHKRLRSLQKNKIEIVFSNEEAGIPDDDEFQTHTITLGGAILMIVNGAEFQWDNTPRIGSGAAVTSDGIAQALKALAESVSESSSTASSVINLNNLLSSTNTYTLTTAIEALAAYESSTGKTYRKSGLVLTYKTDDDTWESKQFQGAVADFTNETLWTDFGSGKVEVDDELDTESENPVQNKVLANAIERLNTKIPNAITSVIANNELVFQTPNGQSVKGKVGITTGADGLLHLTLTDEEGHTYSSPIAGLRVYGNALQYSNDGETWTTVQTFGKLAIKYVQASDPASGDEGGLALVGTTNAYVLKVYVGGSWVSVCDFGTLDLTSDGIMMAGENKTLTDFCNNVVDKISGGTKIFFEWGYGGVLSTTGKPSGNAGVAISMAQREYSITDIRVEVIGENYKFQIWEWDGVQSLGNGHVSPLLQYQSEPYVIPAGKYYQITLRNDDENLSPTDSNHLIITPILESSNIEKRIELIETTRDKKLVHKTYTKNDCFISRIAAGNATENLSGNRVKVVKYVTKGSVITARCTSGRGIAVGIYPSKNTAMLASNNFVKQPVSASFTTDEVSLTVLNDGWLGITMAKSDDSAFTVAEHLEYVNNLSLLIECDEWVAPQDLFVLPNTMNKLFLGKMVQSAMDANQLLPNVQNVSTRVTMSDVIAVPYIGVTIHCHLPYNVFVGYRAGDTADVLDVAGNYFADGDSFTLTSPNRFYRIMFYRYNGDHITDVGQTSLYPLLKAEVDDMIANNDIILYYKKDNDDIITRNHHAETLIKSFTHLMSDVVGVGANHYIYNLDKYPIIAHTSDVHGDAYRLKNFYDFAKMVNAKHCVVTGDACCVSSYNNARFLNVIEDEYDIPTHFCIGNHDVKMITSNVDATLYSTYIQELADKYGYVANNKPYYYYDDTTYKIRFISLNVYEEGNGDDSYWCSISNTQVTWLISTLANTPADYGVLLMYHNPELHIVNSVDNRFMQSNLKSTRTYPLFDGSLQTGITGNPITKIINAFILKESGSGSYVSGIHSGDSGDTVNYSYDFSSLTTQKFIAHVIGHTHCDAIGYYEGYDGSVTGNAKQVVLNAPNTNALYSVGASGLLSNLIDLPRGDSGKTQDCFNVYIVDKDNELIHVVRVGSDRAYGNKVRDYMTISYDANE